MNYNKKTGIPFGVVQGNNVPDLVDEIMTHGENESYLTFKKELAQEIRWAVEKVLEPYVIDASDNLQGYDFDELVNHVEDRGWDFNDEENNYSYEKDYPEGKVNYLLSWLGGAILVWVIKSPWVAYCRPCSPCVPGAGDLDSAADKDSGILAYALPPSELDENFDGAESFLLTSDNGDQNSC